ncbi:MAG: hypothetical protein PHN45_00170 [Methylococcales bacterium]|nr:hypothetical protein [Methylococcales bacterium]
METTNSFGDLAFNTVAALFTGFITVFTVIVVLALFVALAIRTVFNAVYAHKMRLMESTCNAETVIDDTDYSDDTTTFEEVEDDHTYQRTPIVNVHDDE